MPSLQSPLPCILAALRFLTVLPVRHGAADDGRCFAGSLFYFPLIGLGIGLLTALADALLGCILPQAVVALVAIVMLAGISGFLHIDGLADTADGLLSSRPREQKLVIMRDSRTGAMGVTAIVLVLLGKYAALASTDAALVPAALVLMPLAGRCALVFAMAMLPYARPEGGLGALFYSRNTRMAAGVSVLMLLMVLFLFSQFAWFHWQNVVAIGIALAGTVLLFSAWCRKSLGGATGDTLGAVCELSELMVAIAITIRVS
jgi:adenosylcobinamide-GDP ribazoletransferase